ERSDEPGLPGQVIPDFRGERIHRLVRHCIQRRPHERMRCMAGMTDDTGHEIVADLHRPAFDPSGSFTSLAHGNTALAAASTADQVRLYPVLAEVAEIAARFTLIDVNTDRERAVLV